MVTEINVNDTRIVLSQFKIAWAEQVYLRFAAVPYHIQNIRLPYTQTTGNLPQLRKGNHLVPAKSILDYLKERVVNLDEGLSARERSLVKAYSSLLQHDLYQALEWSTWADEEHYYRITKKHISSVVPAPLNLILPRIMRMQTLSRLRANGVVTDEDAKKICSQGYDSLSHALGEKLWLLGGNKPTSVDALLFGHLMDAIIEPINVELNRFPNLVSYCERIRAQFFEASLYRSKKYVTEGVPNLFVKLQGHKLIIDQGTIPIPTSAKRLPPKRKEAAKSKEDLEKEAQLREDNRKSVVFALLAFAAYFLSSFSISFGDDEEESTGANPD